MNEFAQAAPLIESAVRALGLARPAVKALAGGVANRTFRLCTGRRDVVLRIAGQGAAALGANARSEFAMQTLAADAGLAPPVVLADPEGRYIVSEFIVGRIPGSDAMAGASLLARIGAWFARLHALEPPAGLAVVDFGERAAGYLERATEPATAATVRRLRRELARRRAALAPPPRLVSCHHDLHRRNLIDDCTRLLAVDWEYAGPGDPAADLAACAGYHSLDARAVDALVEGYGGSAALRARVASLAWIFDCLWYGWNAVAAQGGLAPDPAEQLRLAARLAH